MSGQQRAKQERIIEAVRHGLEGDAAVDFVHQSGFAMTHAGVARHLGSMGGIVKVQEAIAEGKSNLDILHDAFPDDPLEGMEEPAPDQGELFSEGTQRQPIPFTPVQRQAFETRKLTLTIPSDLHEALKLAAKGEGKNRNDLIVEILTRSLSHVLRSSEEALEEESG